MKNKIIDEFEKSMCKESEMNFNVGDIVSVYKTIFEGKKQRIQRFQGTVIMIKGSLSRKSFTVRKISNGSGVEKTFLYHSPLIKNIEVIQKSSVRRSKLYYLRDRVGARANRLKVKK